MDPETINQYLEVFKTIGAWIGALFLGWWKLSRWVRDVETYQKTTTVQLEKVATANLELVKAITAMTVKIEEREKDTLRLEGALEMHRRDMSRINDNLNELGGNIKALWRTLQNIHPTQVPKRASDY